MYQGEQTLLETRPTRLISFKYYVLFVLAEALALILFADLVPQIQNAGGRISILGWSLRPVLFFPPSPPSSPQSPSERRRTTSSRTTRSSGAMGSSTSGR